MYDTTLISALLILVLLQWRWTTTKNRPMLKSRNNWLYRMLPEKKYKIAVGYSKLPSPYHGKGGIFVTVYVTSHGRIITDMDDGFCLANPQNAGLGLIKQPPIWEVAKEATQSSLQTKLRRHFDMLATPPKITGKHYLSFT